MPCSQYEFWQRRREYHRLLQQLSQFDEGRGGAVANAEIPPLAEIAETSRLAHVAEMLAEIGPDKAPGPDQCRFRDLSIPELWDICRDLSAAILAGDYQPSSSRVIKRGKRDGGTRSLSLRSIVYRIVTTAIYWAIYPAIERVFLPQSYGFRRNRSVWDMLVAIRQDVRTNGHFIVINDIRKAFDFVNPDLAMEDLNRHINEERLRELIRRILGGHPQDVREQAGQGVDQGSPLSPLVLNVLLHHRLDVPLLGTSDPAVRRYADNLCTIAATALQGQERMLHEGELLGTIGMTLKYPVDAMDLSRHKSQQPIELLGYQLTRTQKGELSYGIADSSWESLRESLDEAYDEEDPTAHAQAAMVGWCDACGPALERQRYNTVIDRMLSTAGELGFREISPEPPRRALQGSLDRWPFLLRGEKAA